MLLGFCDSDYEKLREKMHIPFVVYDGFFESNKGICNLTIDNFDGGRQVGAYLKEMGHRRALLISDNDICVDAERMAGFRDGFADGETDFLEVPMNREERYSFYRENFERIRACTAAFAVSDVYAVEFMHFLQGSGVFVPEEISVVGFDDNALCENCFPRLTTVGQEAGERARLAVRSLKRLWSGEGEPTEESLPVSLIIRDSVKNVRRTSENA